MQNKCAGAYCFGICTQILREHFQHLAESVLQVIWTVPDKKQKKPHDYSLRAGRNEKRKNVECVAHLYAENFTKS